MKTTPRLDAALRKLYTAFHNGTLNAMNCKQCAVGNLCDNSADWAKIYNGCSFVNVFVIGSQNRIALTFNNRTGYSAEELRNVETLFVSGLLADDYNYRGMPKFFNREKATKEIQFFGLCAVVEYLCQLDNIPNVMDYTKLFETENKKPKYALPTT